VYDVLMASVERLRVDLIESSHSGDEVRLSGFEQQLVMVVHQAPGITPPLLLDLLRE